MVTLSGDGPGVGLTLAAAAILLCPLAGRVQNDQMLNGFGEAEQVGMGVIDGGGTTTVIKRYAIRFQWTGRPKKQQLFVHTYRTNLSHPTTHCHIHIVMYV